MNAILPTSFAKAAVLTLLHSTWQLALLCVILALVLFIFKATKPSGKYLLAVGAQLIFLASASATFIYFYEPGSAEPAQYPVAPPVDLEFMAGTSTNGGDSGYNWYHICCMVWLCGVTLFGLRRLGAWFWLRNLKSSGISAPTFILEIISRLSEKIQIRRKVSILVSNRVQVPLVMGFFRPVILVPLSMVSGMDVREVEAILAHELAHIRRADFLVNMIQTVAQTLFFFHPGIYWMNALIRRERENACDDLAIAVQGTAVPLAHALGRLAGLERKEGDLALSAGGTGRMPLFNRIKRILVPGTGRLFPERSMFFGLLTAGLILISIAGIARGYSWPVQESAPNEMVVPNIQVEAVQADTIIRKKTIVISKPGSDSVYVNGKKIHRSELAQMKQDDLVEIDSETAKQISRDYRNISGSGQRTRSIIIKLDDNGDTLTEDISEWFEREIPPPAGMQHMHRPFPPMPPAFPAPPAGRRQSEEERAQHEEAWEQWRRAMEEQMIQLRENLKQLHGMEELQFERGENFFPERPGTYLYEFPGERIERRGGPKNGTRELEKELVRDGLIESSDQYSFELNEKELKVNGVNLPI